MSSYTSKGFPMDIDSGFKVTKDISFFMKY